MTRKKRPPSPHAPDLFAVECPACLMAVAAAGDLIGSVARCPLCRADFRVPDPDQQDTSPPQSGRRQPDRAEANKPAEPKPPTVASTSEPPATPATSDPAAPGPTGAAAPDSTSPAPANSGPAPASFGVAPAPAPQPGSLAAPPSPAAETSIPAPLQAPLQAPRPAPLQDDLFDITTEPPPAPDPELAFREPVRTIVSGDEVIELRRLSPEEKRLRQARRNAVMLLAGALVLILITVLLGRGTHR